MMTLPLLLQMLLGIVQLLLLLIRGMQVLLAFLLRLVLAAVDQGGGTGGHNITRKACWCEVSDGMRVSRGVVDCWVCVWEYEGG